MSLLDCQSKYRQFEQQCRDDIDALRSEVQLKVSADMVDQIRRLGLIIERCEMNFNDNPDYLVEYKEVDCALVHI
jgi:hypothetical protein